MDAERTKDQESKRGFTPTPGPWVSGFGGDYLEFRYFVVTDYECKDSAICIIETPATVDVNADCAADSNARLIAAAPDLLAALEAAKAVLDRLLDPETIRATTTGETYLLAIKAEAQARAAVRRARG